MNGSSRLLVGAAGYNAIWGALAIAIPRRLAAALGFKPGGDFMGWRAAGVMVLAYAPAYLWAARHPAEARPILATALFGKSIGAIGWVAGWLLGRFPRRTALLTLLNDAIWLPGLWALVRTGGSRSIHPSPRRGR